MSAIRRKRSALPEPVSLLMLEFLTWISSRRRTYAEAMEAWQSTCPRHTIWEDAIINGFIEIGGAPHPSEVTLTPRGRALLDGSAAHKSTDGA
jgi:hypothetical protein